MLSPSEALERVLLSYTRYYDIKREGQEPFSAEAQFHSHGESYILVKKAKVWDMDSHEYVYFYAADSISSEKLFELETLAWERTLPQVKPSSIHRNSDAILIILVPELDGELKKCVRRMKHSVSYKAGFNGWSDFQVCAYELSTGSAISNRRGRDLRKLLGKVFQTTEKESAN